MKLTRFAFLATLLLLISSACIEHEVIPPPNNKVDLNASFVGYINGTQVELTQNVNNYLGFALDTQIVNVAPVMSKVIYSFGMASTANPQNISLSFGSLEWDATGSATPTLPMFNDFHMTNSGNPVPFKDVATLATNSINGVQVSYTDNTGKFWISRETDPGQTANFTILKQASDGSGDYSLFEVTFSCKVWYVDPQTSAEESIQINNAKLRGWFKR
ncbi:MAG: hypothetical protein EB003_00325 [Flavobacteriia bacterium]|jgi:hypothetical protein|nr:hypothetical protein [Flavobacteriia bacterium]